MPIPTARRRSALRRLALLLGAGLAACSDGGGDNGASAGMPLPPPPPPPPAPAPAPPPPPDFSSVQQAADAFVVEDLAIVLGDAHGAIYTYAKGDFQLDEAYFVASATKLVTGLTVWLLVEDGTLSRDDNPQAYIDFWSDLSGDARSDVTLDQLLGFTSGFTAPPEDPGCIGDGSVSLEDCVRSIHDGGVDELPGQVFYYGPEHMQIAALMAEGATGRKFMALQDDRLFGPLGLSTATRYALSTGDNPRYAGSLQSSVNDYAIILQALLAGELVADLEGYLADRTAGVFFGFRPEAVSAGVRDWHYGFGFWKECDATTYTNDCDENPVISSPGAFGWTPWVDFETGYWGLVAFEETGTRDFSPSAASVELQQEVQSIVEAELNR